MGQIRTVVSSLPEASHRPPGPNSGLAGYASSVGSSRAAISPGMSSVTMVHKMS